MTAFRARNLVVAGACGTLVLAGAVAFDSAGALVRGARVRSALHAIPDLAVASVETDAGRVTLHRAAFARKGVRITAERIDVATPAGAWTAIGPAAAADATTTTTADNIRIEMSDNNVVTVPHIELRGASLTSALTALSGHAVVRAIAVSDALQRLAFESLTVPEVTLSHTAASADDKAGRFTVTKVLVSSVAGGRVGLMSADGVLLAETSAGQTRTVGQVGRIEVHGADVGLASLMATRARTDAAEELHPLLDSLLVDGVAIEPEAGQTFRIGSFEYSGLKGRPLLLDPRRVIDLSKTPEADRSPADRQQLASYVVDAVESFALDRVEIKGVGFAGKNGRDPVAFDLGDFRVDHVAGARTKAISADGFRLDTPEARVSFSRFALNGLDQSGLLEFIAKMAPGHGSPTPEQMMMLAPKLSDISLRDLSVSAQTKDGNGNVDRGLTVKIDMPVSELKIGHYAGRVAADVSAHFQVVYDIVSPKPGSPLEQAQENGFGHFDVTSDYALSWDEATRVLKVGHVTVSAKDLAAVTLGAAFSGVGRELLNGDKAALGTIARDVKFQALNFELTNAGLAEKGLQFAATANNTTIPALKDAIKQQAATGITSSLGSGPAAQQIAAAAAAFIDDPKVFSLTVTAPDGLDLETLTDAKQPDDILGRVVVNAAANPGAADAGSSGPVAP